MRGNPQPLPSMRMRPSLSRIATLGLVIALLGVAAYAFWPTVQQKVSGKAPAGVTTVQDIGQLESAFNRDAGSPRLVLIFSPT